MSLSVTTSSSAGKINVTVSASWNSDGSSHAGDYVIYPPVVLSGSSGSTSVTTTGGSSASGTGTKSGSKYSVTKTFTLTPSSPSSLTTYRVSDDISVADYAATKTTVSSTATFSSATEESKLIDSITVVEAVAGTWGKICIHDSTSYPGMSTRVLFKTTIQPTVTIYAYPSITYSGRGYESAYSNTTISPSSWVSRGGAYYYSFSSIPGVSTVSDVASNTKKYWQVKVNLRETSSSPGRNKSSVDVYVMSKAEALAAITTNNTTPASGSVMWLPYPDISYAMVLSISDPNFVKGLWKVHFFSYVSGSTSEINTAEATPTSFGSASTISKTRVTAAYPHNASMVTTKQYFAGARLYIERPAYTTANGTTQAATGVPFPNNGIKYDDFIKLSGSNGFYYATYTATIPSSAVLIGDGIIMLDSSKITVTATTSSPSAPSNRNLNYSCYKETSAGSGTFSTSFVAGGNGVIVNSWVKGTNKYTSPVSSSGAIIQCPYQDGDAGKKIRMVITAGSYSSYNTAWSKKYGHIDVTLPSPVAAPTISRTTLPSYTTATSVTFKGTYTIDSSLSVSSIKVYNSATGTTTTATVTTSNKSWSASITLGSVGTKNTLTATITDSNGQTATCSDYITRVAKPTISRTTLPSSTTSSSTTFHGTYTVDSNLSVSSIKVYNDNTGTTTTATVDTSAKTWTASISLGYGRNNLTATITDSNNSTATCTDYISRNTSVPSVTCTSPSSNISVTGVTSYTLSGTATASSSSYPISTVKVNSTSATLTAGSGNTKNWSITVSLADGTNTFNIVAADTYGSSNSMTRTITRNRTAPTITFTAPTNGVKLAFNASPYHWAGTLTKDSLATWSSFKLTMWDNVSSGDLDNVNTANGTWAVYTYMAVGKNRVAKVEATDSFGQKATATLTYSRKYEAPKVTWSSPTNTALITKTKTPITGLVDWYYLDGYTPVGPEMRFHYKVQYRGGSSGANTPIDKGAVISLSGGSDTIINENGTDFHYWRQSWSFTPEYGGDFAYIQIAANDFTADDSSSEDMYETRTFPTEARTILYSTKKPELTVTDPTSNITVYSPTYTVTGTCLAAAGTKYLTTTVYVNGNAININPGTDFPTAATSWEKEITLAVGDNNITVYATDSAGNTSASITKTITYKSIDLYCNVEVDFDGLITNEIKMREFTCKAGSPNKVKYLRCYENGVMIGDATPGNDYYEGVYTLGISTDVEGRNEYYIEMEDYAGNKVKSSKFYVTYTAKTATISITSPTEGQVFKSKVTVVSDLAADTTKTVTGSVTCGNTYTTVTEIAGDGTPITVSNPSGTTSFTYQHTTKVGTNSTIVTATNSAGNIATLTRNFVYVPYMAPTIELSGVLKYTNHSSITIKDNEWWVVLNHARASLVGTSNLDVITNVKVTSSDGKTVQLQFSEDTNAETGENTTTYKISAKTLELVDTTNTALETPREITLTLVATSKFGEVTSKQIGKIKYFAGKPIITFTNAEQNLITNQPSWNILGTVTKYEHTDPVIYIDGNGSAVLIAASGDRTWTFDKKVSLPSDGGYDFLFKVTDIYGNEAEATYFIQRFIQPPLITVTDPKENLITNSLEIASHVIGETKPAANFVTLSQVTVNGAPYALAAAPDDRGYFAIDTMASGIVEGVNEITVRVTDSVGNVATVTRHLRLDTHAPLIKDILADSISVDTNGIIHLTCKVTDPD